MPITNGFNQPLVSELTRESRDGMGHRDWKHLGSRHCGWRVVGSSVDMFAMPLTCFQNALFFSSPLALRVSTLSCFRDHLYLFPCLLSGISILPLSIATESLTLFPYYRVFLFSVLFSLLPRPLSITKSPLYHLDSWEPSLFLNCHHYPFHCQENSSSCFSFPPPKFAAYLLLH